MLWSQATCCIDFDIINLIIKIANRSSDHLPAQFVYTWSNKMKAFVKKIFRKDKHAGEATPSDEHSAA